MPKWRRARCRYSPSPSPSPNMICCTYTCLYINQHDSSFFLILDRGIECPRLKPQKNKVEEMRSRLLHQPCSVKTGYANQVTLIWQTCSLQGFENATNRFLVPKNISIPVFNFLWRWLWKLRSLATLFIGWFENGTIDFLSWTTCVYWCLGLYYVYYGN